MAGIGFVRVDSVGHIGIQNVTDHGRRGRQTVLADWLWSLARLLGQRTIRNAVSVDGVGLHSGGDVRVTIRPGECDTGIVFHRIDLCPTEPIAATATNVVDTRLATTLGRGDARISAVEHLLAAFAGLGIDNAHVDVSGPELPIMDGSAGPFVRLLRASGFAEQASRRRFLEVVREVTYVEGAAMAKLSPYDGFRVEYTMEYDHPFFRDQCQYATVDFSTATFERDVSQARTFGFLADVPRLHAMGLALGGGLDNAVVLDERGIVNDGGLRYNDEFAKHKILDVIGDLSLCGCPIIGAFAGYRSGHATNNALLRCLMADSSAHRIVTFDRPQSAPPGLQQSSV